MVTTKRRLFKLRFRFKMTYNMELYSTVHGYTYMKVSSTKYIYSRPVKYLKVHYNKKNITHFISTNRMMRKKIVILDILFESHFEGNTKTVGHVLTVLQFAPR